MVCIVRIVYTMCMNVYFQLRKTCHLKKYLKSVAVILYALSERRWEGEKENSVRSIHQVIILVTLNALLKVQYWTTFDSILISLKYIYIRTHTHTNKYNGYTQYYLWPYGKSSTFTFSSLLLPPHSLHLLAFLRPLSVMWAIVQGDRGSARCRKMKKKKTTKNKNTKNKQAKCFGEQTENIYRS